MAKLQILTTREVQAAREGDHSDGGGLILRVRGTSASWVLRYTSPTGRRREMGLGIAHRGTRAGAVQAPPPSQRPSGFQPASARLRRFWTIVA